MTSVLSIQSLLDLDDGNYLRREATFLNDNIQIATTQILRKGSNERLHFHEKPHLSLVLNGGVIDKRQRYETERRSGDLMFFHGGEPHRTIYKLFPSTNINLEIDHCLLVGKTLSENHLATLSKEPSTKFAALRIHKELIINDEFSKGSIELMLAELLSNKTEIKKTKPQWLDKIVELLNEKWNEPLSLNQLAEAANVYPTTISKYFPKYISCTLGEYRRRLKIEKSLSFIKTSELSLTEIAYHCGFADQSHFTRTFKQMTGFLPRQYEVL